MTGCLCFGSVYDWLPALWLRYNWLVFALSRSMTGCVCWGAVCMTGYLCVGSVYDRLPVLWLGV